MMSMLRKRRLIYPLSRGRLSLIPGAPLAASATALALFSTACAVLSAAPGAGSPLLESESALASQAAVEPAEVGGYADPTPTEDPAPTDAPGPVSTATPLPLNLATPAIVIERPAESVSPTPLPPNVALPPASIRIYRPGPGSHVTSPFTVYGRGGPSFNERVSIRLIGEDGRVITERRTYLLVYPGRAGNFVAQIEFSTPYVAEEARLEVSTQDPRYGRMDHLTTVNLILLSAGGPLIHPELEGPEKLAILEPRDGARVENDFILVRGAGWVNADVPVTVELHDRSGNVLASRQVTIDAPDIGRLGAFEVQLPFEIPYSQYGRVAVYEPSSGIPGIVFYSSVEVWLQR